MREGPCRPSWGSPEEIEYGPYRDTALQKGSAGKEQGPPLRCPAGKGVRKLACRVGEEIDADPDIREICMVRGDPFREGAFVACKDDHDIEIAPGNSPPPANDPKRMTPLLPAQSFPLSEDARRFVECGQPLPVKPAVHQIVELLSGEAELLGHDGEQPIAYLLLSMADPVRMAVSRPL